MAPSCKTRPSASRTKSSWIDHVDRAAAGIGNNLVEDVRELHLVLVTGDVTDMRRTDDIFHREKRMSRVKHRLLLINIDRGHSRPARFECSYEGASLNQPCPAGVDQNRSGFHSREILAGDDAASCLHQTKVEGDHVALFEKGVLARGHDVAGCVSTASRRLTCPDEDSHSEGSAVTGDHGSDAPVAENA